MRPLYASISATAVMIAALGCGAPDEPGDWIAVVGGDTITIEDVASQWNGMRNRERTLFLETERPDSALVESMVNRQLLKLAAREAGYLDLPEFRAMRRAWSRIEKSIAAREEINREHMAGVSRDEIESYRSRMGEICWLTMYPDRDGEQISMHVLDLPWERLMLIDTMDPGETGVDETGKPFRFDSITRVSPAESPQIDPAMYDDSLLTTMIGAGRTRSAVRRMVEEALDTLPASVDSAGIFGLSAFLAGRIPEPPEGILLESGLGSWDGMEMAVEASMAKSRFPLDPQLPGHLLFVVENLLTQSVLSRYLERTHPEVADSIESQAESFLVGAAAESLYVDSVLAMSVPDSADLRQTWESAGDTINVSERRSLELVALPGRDFEHRFTEMREAGRLAELLPALPFVEELSADSPPSRFTRPLRAEDLPPEVAGRAFNLSPADTTEWVGPIGVPDRGWTVFFRLRETIPAGRYDYETSLPEVAEITRRRLEEDRMRELLQSLKSRFGAEINRQLLRELPDDPSDW
ncbi:MAG: hypothetical protein R6U36_09825 [Candidatus Fermentibacteraceae bacterium]